MSFDLYPFGGCGAYIRHVSDIALSYLYGIKFQGPVTPLVLAIRQEIYNEPYGSIDFASHRDNVHKVDLYNPRHPVGTIADCAARIVEPFFGVLNFVRQKALDYVYKLIVYEDENTGYQCIAPISKSLHLICRYVVDGPESTAFKGHLIQDRRFPVDVERGNDDDRHQRISAMGHCLHFSSSRREWLGGGGREPGELPSRAGLVGQSTDQGESEVVRGGFQTCFEGRLAILDAGARVYSELPRSMMP